MFGVGVGVRVGGRTASSSGGFDPDAQAFFDRVTTAGGTLTTTEKNATNQLVLDMKSAGIWTSMKAVYPMVGASAAACAQNLKSSSFTGTFTSGWTFASTGVTPNGTSAYMDTNFNAQALGGFTNDYSMFMYTRTLNVSDGGNGIGAAGGRTDLLDYGGARYFTCGLSPTQINSGTTWIGLSLGSRISSTSNKLYRNNTNTYSNNTLNTSTSFTSTNLLMGSFSGVALFTNYQYALFGMGNGLTDTQASNFYTAVQTFNQTLNRQVGAQIVSDADAQAYINRVYTAGGTLTNTEANAVNQLTIDMKAAGIWTAMKAVYPMVGSSAAACAQNLKSSSFTGTFSSGWTFASTGVTGNGTSAYFNTNVKNNTNLTDRASHWSAYFRTLGNDGFIGYYSAAAGAVFGVQPKDNTNKIAIGLNNLAATGVTSAAGFLIGSVNSSTNAKLYLNNSLVKTNNTTSDLTGYSLDFYLGALNSTGTPILYGTQQNAFLSLGDNLTDTQATALYNAVQTMNTTLSRQV
jgi:hypothetical protein